MAWENPYLPPSNMTEQSFTQWWGENSGKVGSAWTDYRNKTYIDPMSEWRNKLATDYTGMQWEGSPWQARYNTQQGGMDALLARLASGPQASDNQQALDSVTQMYGYSPASWTSIMQGMSDRLNASNVMTSAANIATNLESTPYGQEQAKAMRAAQRNATEAVGKQLESIFGERGGLGGFQAAYEMTGQLQSSFLQQQAQNSLAMFDRAVSAVNAENGYYQQLIQQGAIQAQDYLQFRWDALQAGYQDYMAAMNQTMQEWQTLESVDENQFNMAQNVIKTQIDALTQQMAAEMGTATNETEYLQQIYNTYSQYGKDLDSLAPEVAGQSIKTWVEDTMSQPGYWLSGGVFTAPILGVAWLVGWALNGFK